MPKKIRELVRELGKAAWMQEKGAGKGSHRKFVHPRVKRFVLICGQDGDDAPRYLEKQVRLAIDDSKRDAQ